MFEFLFGCAHKRLSFPQTYIARKKVIKSNVPHPPVGEKYVACLECGTEFIYDWDKMKVIETVENYENRLDEATT